jgi:hypothetical protein
MRLFFILFFLFLPGFLFSQVLPQELQENNKEKFWNFRITYEIAHNMIRERPDLTNALVTDLSLNLPADFILLLHGGVSSTYSYAREDAYGKNASYAVMDGLVSYAKILKEIFRSDGLSFSGAFSLLFPYTSRFDGIRNGWYLGIKPSLRISYQQGGFLLSDEIFFQQNFHEADAIFVKGGKYTAYNLTQFKIGDQILLSYTFSKFSISAAFAFVNLSAQKHFLEEDSKNMLTFQGAVSYNVSDWFSIETGFVTLGPERRNGGYGNDMWYPGEPLNTEIYMDFIGSF